MPVYEFQCQNDECESLAIYDHKLSINEPHDLDCNFCGEPMKKVYSSVPTVVFNGSGFYSTDNR
jgi:predicted nucleic acid-binding Zn ribbon protein